MIFILGAHGGGGEELARVLRVLGCDVHMSPSRALDDALIAAADGTWEWTSPERIEAALASLPVGLWETARAAASRSHDAAFHDPRLCLTLPFWRWTARDATYIVVHRDPLATAQDLLAERAIPLSAGFALWQQYMLSAIHHSRGARRLLVSHDELRRDPASVAREIHRFVGGHGTTLARLHELARLPHDPLTEVRAGSERAGLLTRAQLDLREALRAGRWPVLDPEAPYTLLARDPLVLLQRANHPEPSPASSDAGALELARELGRARAAAWELELRERHATSRWQRAEADHARALLELNGLRAAMKRERALDDDEAQALRSELASVDAAERLEISGWILETFQRRLYQPWIAVEGVPYCGVPGARPLRVMVGTLQSDENEFDQCVQSVRKQTYRQLKHEIFSGLGKKESIATLMTAFQRSDCDLLIKVDADMVLTAPDFVERIVRVFQASPEIDLLCVAILDFFSGGPIQGINAYRKTAAWSADRQDSLFTDKTQVPDSKRLVVWPTFVRDAVHAPNPSPFQAFHFGVHRGIKTLQPGAAQYLAARAEEQLLYLEKTWNHYLTRRDRRLALACLGFELALTGRHALEELDYTNPSLRASFAEYESLDVDRIEEVVLALRAQRVASENVNRVRDRRSSLLAQQQAPIESIVALLPHTKVYGGVNRFFELARQFARLGVRFVIAQPDGAAATSAERLDYPDVEVRSYSDVIEQPWDVVLCGDASGGVMLTMPLFRSRLAAVYLLNGWGRSRLNLEQIAIVSPDVLVANSSYAAAQYVGRAPAVVPGGVDLETFYPPAHRPVRTNRVRICAYPGRRKPSKRFEDAVEACQILHDRGVPVELNAFDQGALWIDTKFPFVFHGALAKADVRQLFWTMDVMVCAEEDGGWSNPAAEAMACGTSLVCTDAGTIDYAIDDETALVVPCRSPRAIADAIERLYRDPELSERLRVAGLARIRAFGWPQVARSLLDTLNDARPDAEARSLKNTRAIERFTTLTRR